jgi:hypothetical protein
LENQLKIGVKNENKEFQFSDLKSAESDFLYSAGRKSWRKSGRKSGKNPPEFWRSQCCVPTM